MRTPRSIGTEPTRHRFGSIAVAVCFLVAAPTVAQDRLPENQLRVLRAQVAKSFAGKFSAVTSDIPRTSAENLDAIESELRRRIGERKFAEWAPRAGALARSVRSTLTIQSETSLPSAVSILRSGAFFSLDELIRRGTLPLAKKANSATSFFIDGAIGQQDTVFLAIKPADIPADRPVGIEWSFGDAKFVFDESVLEDGYFTPYAFDQSPSPLELYRKGGNHRDRLAKAIRLYRKFVFRGKAAFERLLNLSAAQSLWERERRHALPIDALKSMQDAFARRDIELRDVAGDPNEIGRRMNAPMAAEPLCPFMRFLGQACPLSVLPGTPRDLEQSQVLRVDGRLGEGVRVLGAYTGLPVSVDDLGIGLAHLWGFWELKVPTRLPLRKLRSIEIRRSSHPDSTDENVRKLIAAAEDYARKRGLRITRTTEIDRHAEARDRRGPQVVVQGAETVSYEIIRLGFDR